MTTRSPASPLFAPAATVHGDARVADGTREPPLTVETPAQQWAYAAWFCRTESVPSDPLLLHVTIRVDEGRMNVGLLNAAGTDFVSHGTVDASPSPSTVELLAVAPSDVGPLMLRNAWENGPSRGEVLEIDVAEIHDPDAARTPPLSAPAPTPGWSRYYGTAGDGGIERLRVARFEALRSPVTLTWTDGLSLRILPGDQLSRAVFVSSAYEPNTMAVLRSFLRPGDVFLDVGANAGVISLAASIWVGRSGRVYAFEPSEREFARLLDTVHRNPGSAVYPVKAAVTAQKGSARLRVAEDGAGGLNTLGTAFPYGGVGTARVETVQTVSLDDFVAAEDIRFVRAIKLDIEGAEGLALTGAAGLLARDHPVLVIEVFGRSLQGMEWTVKDLEHLLRTAGYAMFAIDDADATLHPLGSLDEVNEANVVALPA